MNTYNKIMQMFWLAMATVIIASVTFKGFTEGFDRWAFYYVFALLAITMFFVRRFMMNRMKKHQEFLNNKEKQEE